MASDASMNFGIGGGALNSAIPCDFMMTGMQNGRGAPEKSALNSMMLWCRSNSPTGEGYSRFLSLARAQAGQGIPLLLLAGGSTADTTLDMPA